MNYSKSTSISYSNGRQKTTNSRSKTTETFHNNGMQFTQLKKLFENGLKDICSVGNSWTKIIPKMIQQATSRELRDLLKNHLLKNQEQVSCVEELFESMDNKPLIKKCGALESLMKEAERIPEENEPGSMRDVAIISAIQKAIYYNSASFTILCQFAETLGLDEICEKLQNSLEKEKATSEKLTKIVSCFIVLEGEEEYA